MERNGRSCFEALVDICVQRLEEKKRKEEMMMLRQQLTEEKKKREAERKTVGSQNKKATATKTKQMEILPPPQPLLDLNNSETDFSWAEIKPGSLKTLFQRVLTATDVERSAHRLFLNKKETEDSLIPVLSYREKEKLGELGQGLPVMGVDHKGRRYEIVIKYWPSIGQYALIKDWIVLAGKNGFTKGVRIEVTCFRHGLDDELGLVITPCPAA